MTYPQRIGLLLLFVAFSLAGCDRDESSIRTYSAPKGVARAPMAANEPAPADASANSSESSSPLRWTLPAGWKQVGGSSEMRLATFDIAPGTPDAQLTITPLGPEAGKLQPNVDRWAKQLGVPGATEADLPKYVVDTQISGEPAHIVDIVGAATAEKPAMHLLAAIIPHEGRTWFVKLTAPQTVAESQKANFQTFVHSLQFTTGKPNESVADAPSTPGTALAAKPAEGSMKLASWKTPEGWTEEPGANDMRVTAFRAGSGAEAAEVIVTRIRQGQTGSFLDNINRWRGQVGLEPIVQQKPGEMKTVTVAGHEALLMSYTGPQPPLPTSPKQLVVSVDIEGGDYWFVKMLGPQSVVTTQQDAFRQFLASMQFVPESH